MINTPERFPYSSHAGMPLQQFILHHWIIIGIYKSKEENIPILFLYWIVKMSIICL